MKLRTRRILFYVLVVLFPLSGGGVLLYADGWRLDPETFAPVKTGALYIESMPRDAAILVDGAPFGNRSGLISRGTLISGLVPRSYEVTVTKDGFSPWRRSLAVESALVSEAASIILVPESGVSVPLPVPARAIEAAESGLVTLFADGRLTLSGTRLPGNRFVAVNANGSAAITYDEKRNAYLLTPLPDARSSTNLTVLFNNLKERSLGLPGTVLPQEVIAHPFDAKKVIVRTERALYVLDTERLTITLIANPGTKSVGAVFADGQSVIWSEYSAVNGESAVMTMDLILRTSSRLAAVPERVKNLGKSPAGGVLALSENGGLLLLERGAPEARLLETAAAETIPSPKDQRFIVRLSDGSLALWDLKDESRRKRALLPLKADELAWHKSGAHIFARRNGTVSFVELFDDGGVFALPLSESAMAMAYHPAQNLFYLLEGGALRSFPL